MFALSADLRENGPEILAEEVTAHRTGQHTPYWIRNLDQGRALRNISGEMNRFIRTDFSSGCVENPDPVRGMLPGAVRRDLFSRISGPFSRRSALKANILSARTELSSATAWRTTIE